MNNKQLIERIDEVIRDYFDDMDGIQWGLLQDLKANLHREGEPVAVMTKRQGTHKIAINLEETDNADCLPQGAYDLYTAPPAPRRLSDERIEEIWEDYKHTSFNGYEHEYFMNEEEFEKAVRAIERELGMI